MIERWKSALLKAWKQVSLREPEPDYSVYPQTFDGYTSAQMVRAVKVLGRTPPQP